jgi:hypothetical protein
MFRFEEVDKVFIWLKNQDYICAALQCEWFQEPLLEMRKVYHPVSFLIIFQIKIVNP